MSDKAKRVVSEFFDLLDKVHRRHIEHFVDLRENGDKNLAVAMTVDSLMFVIQAMDEDGISVSYIDDVARSLGTLARAIKTLADDPGCEALDQKTADLVAQFLLGAKALGQSSGKYEIGFSNN